MSEELTNKEAESTALVAEEQLEEVRRAEDYGKWGKCGRVLKAIRARFFACSFRFG